MAPQNFRTSGLCTAKKNLSTLWAGRPVMNNIKQCMSQSCNPILAFELTPGPTRLYFFPGR